MTVEELAAQVLQRSTCHSMSLQHLHEQLVHELGGTAGTYHELHLRLKQRNQLFSVVCRADPLYQPGPWTGAVREQYASALQQAGLDTSPVVTLLQLKTDQPDVVGCLRATLMDVASQLGDDPTAREDVLAALTGLAG